MTLADILTILRVVLTPVVMGLWVSPHPAVRLLGLAVFIAAGVTDLLDGLAARAIGRTTRFGAYLDPLADKILVLGAAMALIAVGRLSVWLVLVLLVRELAVTGLRAVLPAESHMPASLAAKWKTTSQLIALGASAVLTGLVPAVLWSIALVLTVWSATEYFRHHWPTSSRP